MGVSQAHNHAAPRRGAGEPDIAGGELWWPLCLGSLRNHNPLGLRRGPAAGGGLLPASLHVPTPLPPPTRHAWPPQPHPQVISLGTHILSDEYPNPCLLMEVRVRRLAGSRGLGPYVPAAWPYSPCQCGAVERTKYHTHASCHLFPCLPILLRRVDQPSAHRTSAIACGQPAPHPPPPQIMPNLLSRRVFKKPITRRMVEPGYRDAPDLGAPMAIVFCKVGDKPWQRAGSLCACVPPASVVMCRRASHVV